MIGEATENVDQIGIYTSFPGVLDHYLYVLVTPMAIHERPPQAVWTHLIRSPPCEHSRATMRQLQFLQE